MTDVTVTTKFICSVEIIPFGISQHLLKNPTDKPN